MENSRRVTNAGVVIAVALAALVAGGVGYVMGTNTERVAVHRNVLAQSGDDQVSAQAEGWSYSIPLDVQWQDAGGSWHDRGRPACLPNRTQVPITFASTLVVVPGPGAVTYRAVVWVSCKN